MLSVPPEHSLNLGLGQRWGWGEERLWRGRRKKDRAWERIITKGIVPCSLGLLHTWLSERANWAGSIWPAQSSWGILYKNRDCRLFLRNLQCCLCQSCVSARGHNWLGMSSSCPFKTSMCSPAGNCPQAPPAHPPSPTNPKLFYIQPKSLISVVSWASAGTWVCYF